LEHGTGPTLGEIAHAQDLTVAHMPQCAREIADLSAAQTDVLDFADSLAEVDGVTDAVLVLDDDEVSGEVVADELLSAEGDGHTGDAGRGQDRGDIEVERVEDHELGDDADEYRGKRRLHPPHGSRSLRPPFLDRLLVDPGPVCLHRGGGELRETGCLRLLTADRALGHGRGETSDEETDDEVDDDGPDDDDRDPQRSAEEKGPIEVVCGLNSGFHWVRSHDASRLTAEIQ